MAAPVAPAGEAAVQAGTDVFARALQAVARSPTRIQYVARTRYMVTCYTTMVRSLRVAFVSPSGLGNLGDAAIIDSFVAGIRRRQPGAEIVGFTLNPADTEVRHGVDAYTCGAFSLPHYTIRRAPRMTPAAAAASSAGAPGEDAGDEGDEAVPPLRRLRRAVAAIPGARQGRRAVSMAVAEVRHRREVAARLEGFDHVVASGGGQLDEFWGGPFGHPYTLYRFSRAARRAGAQFAVLSVGTGTLATPLGRRFVRRALESASYRSFRDARSRELAAPAGAVESDLVVPDLAYGLPVAEEVRPARGRRLIGVAPMCYADPRVWPRPDAERYGRHLSTMAAIAARAVRDGHEVAMFGTDRPDAAPVEECHALAVAQLTGDERARLRVHPLDSVGPLMALLGSCDAVVAARFHGVLLAHVVGCPVIAVSHERKVATLMSELGHEAYCAPIDELDPAAASARLAEVLADRDAISAHIREVAAEYRRRVDAQFDRVFGAPR
ncbi:MAG TPA: polysaccharide pyruvyl transferase family protein [Kofleriaceae bacterium]|nr:polysaccharide pyruvyl transferase family protein [Kofleriaceae bacterium]